MTGRELYAGLIRLHILHHAAEAPVFGLGLMAELARHGYRLSPGTLYPLLHSLERRGYLASRLERVGPRRRRLYRATPAGRHALRAARRKVEELFGELFDHPKLHHGRSAGVGASRSNRGTRGG